jgi:predicted SprT family Zn-dependent metalloprotease
VKIYSETTFTFIEKCKVYLKDIIQKETDIKMKQSRVTYNNYTYPLSIAVFTGQQKIGYFDQTNYEIGLNSNLIYSIKESLLKDILRHELAHYITFLKHGNVQPHGEEFKALCMSYKWDRSISKASMDIQLANSELTGDIETEKMIFKIKNLLKLSESDNEHEAKLATAKANALMIKHNLERVHKGEEDTLYVQEVYYAKKRNSKLSAIYSILSHFLVSPVMNYTTEGVKLEITGSKTNIEIGEYIVTFLDRELDKLWDLAKYKNNLKGLKQKNSFLAGIAKGFDQKMNEDLFELSSDESNALTIIKEDLREKTDRIYGRLRSSTSNSSIDKASLSLGKTAGKNLTINKGLSNKNKKRIGWFR